MSQKIDLSDYGRYCKFYNQCADILKQVYTHWFGSSVGVTHNDIRRMVELVSEGKTSITRYKRELNDYIYYSQYKEHLYKDMQSKDIKLYTL